jgi:transcriptional regulatory protein AMDR
VSESISEIELPMFVTNVQIPPRPLPASSGVALTDLNAAKDGEYIYKRYLVEFVDQPELSVRPIDSKARMTYIGTEVSNINYIVHQQYRPASSLGDVSHYPANRIARSRISGGPADRLPLDAFELPSKSVVDQLLDAYFRCINPGFPVIDEDLFMAQYRAKDSSDPPSLLLLQAILVAGAHALYTGREGKVQRAASKATFFRRARCLLEGHFERNRDTIVQAALLLTWHSDGLEDVTANAWHWLGLALRTAIGLGMHRDTESSNLVPHNKRMWRRVWWLLFTSDVWISLQYGRPQGVHLKDCTVGDLKDEDFKDCGHDAQPSHIVQSVRLAVIVSDVMRARTRSKTLTDKRKALQEADERLADWAVRLPQDLHPHITDHDTIGTTLHLHYNAVLILLHRPEPAASNQRANAGPANYADVEICVTAAGVIQDMFHSICESGRLNSMWLSGINCLFTALIQLKVDLQLANPLLAISAHRRFDSALLSLKELSEYWPNAQSILHFFQHSIKRAQTSPMSRPMPHAPTTELGLQQDTAYVRERRPDAMSSNQAELHTGKDDDPTGADSHFFGADSIAPAQAAAADLDEQSLDTTNILDAWESWQTQGLQTVHSDEFLFTF